MINSKLISMKKPIIIILLSTLYLMFFYASPHIGVPDAAIVAMFVLSPIILVNLVFVILNYTKHSRNTFQDRTYDGFNYKKINLN